MNDGIISKRQAVLGVGAAIALASQARAQPGPQSISGANASNAFTTATGSSTARTLAARAADIFNVKDYGALGNGSNDDTAAFQAAINAAKATFFCGTVFIPFGTYVISSPLNCSTATNQQGLAIIGSGKANTQIYATLSTAGPVFDFTGIWFPHIADLRITSQNNSSLATCAVLVATNNYSSNDNYNGSMARCLVEMYSNDTIAGVCVVNSDLFYMDECVINAENSAGTAIAFSGGYTIASGISSPFQTLTSTGNQTDYRLNNSWFVGNLAIDFTGGNGISLMDSYAAVAGTLNSDNCIIRVNYIGQQMCLKAFNLRTENQVGSVTTLNCIYVKSTTTVFKIDLYGCELNMYPTTNGAFVKIDTGNNIILNLNFFTGGSGYPLFNCVAGNIHSVTGASNVTVAPTMASGATIGTFTHIFDYNEDFSTFLQAHLTGVGINQNLPIVPPIQYTGSVNALVAAGTGYNKDGFRTVSSYTGGSGTAVVDSYLIPAGMLVGSYGVTHSLKLKLSGLTAAANVTIGVLLNQGGNTYTLGTYAVATSGTAVAIEVVVDNTTATTGFYVSAILIAGTTIGFNAVLTSPYGTIDPTVNSFVDVTVSCSSSNPYVPQTRHIVVA